MAHDPVIVPTYQERDNLPPLLAGIAEYLPDADVLVVDDASPDGRAGLWTTRRQDE